MMPHTTEDEETRRMADARHVRVPMYAMDALQREVAAHAQHHADDDLLPERLWISLPLMLKDEKAMTDRIATARVEAITRAQIDAGAAPGSPYSNYLADAAEQRVRLAEAGARLAGASAPGYCFDGGPDAAAEQRRANAWEAEQQRTADAWRGPDNPAPAARIVTDPDLARDNAMAVRDQMTRDAWRDAATAPNPLTASEEIETRRRREAEITAAKGREAAESARKRQEDRLTNAWRGAA